MIAGERVILTSNSKEKKAPGHRVVLGEMG